MVLARLGSYLRHRRYHGTPNDHGTPYYRCSGHDSLLASGEKRTSLKIPAEMLDKQVWEMVISHILYPEGVLASWQARDRVDDSPVKDWENERESWRRELQALDNSYDKVINIYLYTPMTGEKLKAKVDRINAEKAKVEARIAELDVQIKQYHEAKLSQLELEALVTFIRNVCLQVEHKDKVDFDRKRYIFELWGMRVRIEDNYFIVDFTLPATSSMPARPVTLRSGISGKSFPLSNILTHNHYKIYTFKRGRQGVS